MRQFVEDFVQTCDTCCKEKMPSHHPYGLLEPLPIPSKPWQSIALYFVTDLPISNGFDAILTVVDRYTKMAHFLPCTKEIFSEEHPTHLRRSLSSCGFGRACLVPQVCHVLAISDDQTYKVGTEQSGQRTQTSQVEKGEADRVTEGKCRAEGKALRQK